MSTPSGDEAQLRWRGFEISGHLRISRSPTGVPMVSLRSTDGHTAEVSLFGAQVTAWRTPTEEDLLFMSTKADRSGSRPIRGGIPVVFPQFGSGPMPSHGFARVSTWDIRETTLLPSGDVQLRLALEPTAKTRELWPHNFTCELLVVAGATLKLRFTLVNLGQSDLEFQCALHTYFAIGEIDSVRVRGLEGLTYLDSLNNRARSAEPRSEIAIDGEIDRIYTQVPPTLNITGRDRAFTLRSSGFPDAVLWNPWIERSKRFEDLGAEDYLRFVCVEAGAIAPPVVLPHGIPWRASHEIAYSTASPQQAAR